MNVPRARDVQATLALHDDRGRGVHLPDAVVRRVAVEADRFGDVGLGDDRDVRGVERERVLERFVLAFRYRQQNQPEILAQIVGGGTNEIAYIFDEQEIQFMKIPSLQRLLHHRGFQVTDRAGDDLLDRCLAASQALRVVFCSEISDQGGGPEFSLQHR